MARTKGSMGRSRERLLKALQSEWGEDFDPVMQMARNAMRMQEYIEQVIGDTEDPVSLYTEAVDTWGKVARFTNPQPKAVEVTQISDDRTMEDMENELRSYGIDPESIRTGGVNHPGVSTTH
jgi:hypothetical protein